MNTEIQKNMRILMGDDTKQEEQTLSTADKKKLSFALVNLFFGLAGENWSRNGKTLGAAWYEALGQIKSMTAAKDKSNPAARYLGRQFAIHNVKWSEILMTRATKDKKLEMDGGMKQKWHTECAKKIGDAMNVINDIMARHNTRQPARPHVTPKQVPPEILQKYLAMQQHKQHA